MRWDESQSSENVEDRRGMKGGVVAGGGILSIIVALVGVFVFGLDPRQAQQLGNVVGAGAGAVQKKVAGAGGAPGTQRPPDEVAKFTSAVVFMTEEVWTEQFRKLGERYEKPKVVLFSDRVSTGCGTAPSAVGPFYCPADRKVYLDPTFFDELDRKLGGSKAAFSQAYVIAHEVGHHIQNQLGYSARVDRKRGTRDENDASVRLELQADYLAGCWAHYADQKYRILEPGDLEAAIKSANAIGDDRLQKRSQGWTSPESYTHGTSDQRVRSFTAGYKTGDLSKLDRFFEVRSAGDL